LYEELLADVEKTLPTYNPKVKVAEVGWLDYRDVLVKIHRLLRAYQPMKEYILVNHMKAIVPEFISSNENYSEDSGDSESMEIDFSQD